MAFFRTAVLLVCLVYIVVDALASDSCNFDHFTYTQQWPPGECKNPISGKYCDIPKNVTTWTVHGLWPSNGSSQTPEHCNGSLHFDLRKLDPIIGQMLKFWPNLLPDTQKDSFWKHEWDKHGTCALCKTDLDSELKYFSKGLSLMWDLPMAKALAKANIVPDNQKKYLVKDVLGALQDAFGEGTIVMECAYTKDPPTQYIKQVEICIDTKTYAPVRCPPSNHSNNNAAQRLANAVNKSGASNVKSKPSSALEAYLEENVVIDSESPPHSVEYRLRKIAKMEEIKKAMGRDEFVGKCAGDPIYCECIETLMIPKYDEE